jgi:hypothetical protein
MAVYEYKILTSTESDDDDETMLNTYGGDGWELVSVHVSEVTYIEGGDEDDEEEEGSGEEYVEEVVTYYLKREKIG